MFAKITGALTNFRLQKINNCLFGRQEIIVEKNRLHLTLQILNMQKISAHLKGGFFFPWKKEHLHFCNVGGYYYCNHISGKFYANLNGGFLMTSQFTALHEFQIIPNDTMLRLKREQCSYQFYKKSRDQHIDFKEK